MPKPASNNPTGSSVINKARIPLLIVLFLALFGMAVSGTSNQGTTARIASIPTGADGNPIRCSPATTSNGRSFAAICDNDKRYRLKSNFSIDYEHEITQDEFNLRAYVAEHLVDGWTPNIDLNSPAVIDLLQQISGAPTDSSTVPTTTSTDGGGQSTGSGTAASYTCKGGVVLPSGVDPRACGPVPAGASVPQIANGSGVFFEPSGNIGCTMYSNGSLRCDVLNHTWQLPSGLPCDATEPPACEDPSPNGWSPTIQDGQVINYIYTDSPDFINPPVAGNPSFQVGVGQVVAYGGNACLVEQSGVTCWTGNTGHGFKVSASVAVYW